MPFQAFGTTANQQFSVSTSVIVLDTQISGDSNINKLRNTDMVIVRVNNGQPIRYLVDGGIPTATHGNITSSGFVAKGADIRNIKMIRDTNSTASAEVCVHLATGTIGIEQSLEL